nr:outer membrane lipoprotein-sorting protein [Candidatus Bipolaricaulota bacterium]
MPKKMLLRTLVLVAIAVALVAGAVSAITGDEILAQMEDSFGTDRAEQGLLMSLRIDNRYAGGIESSYHLAVVAQEGIDPAQPAASDETTYMLMYFRGGDDDGSIFLLHTPEDDSIDARLWIFLPALGLTKELVSEDDQEGSFAGSTISYGDIAGAKEMRDDYAARILREDTYEVGG